MAADEEWEESEEEENEASPTAAKASSIFVPLLLNFVKRKGWVVGLVAIACVLLALLASRRDPSTFVGKFEILVEPVTSEQKRTDASVLASGAGKSEEALTEVDYPTLLRILSSTELLQSIAEKLHKQAPKLDAATIFQGISKGLTVQRVSQGTSRFDVTKIIEVTYEGTNPEWVQLVLDTTAQRFLEYSQQERKKNLDSGTQFIDRQLERLNKQINVLQDQQEKLQKTYDFIDPQDKGKDVAANYSLIQQKLQTLRGQLQDLQRLAANLEKKLGFNAQEALIAINLSQDPERQSLLALRQKIDGEIALQSGIFQAISPTLQDLYDQRKNINQLLEQKTQAILQRNRFKAEPNSIILTFQDTTRQQLIQQLVTTRNQLDSSQNQLLKLVELEQQAGRNFQTMPNLIKRYQELDRQLALNINLVNQLSAQREGLLVEKAQKRTPWQIISPPTLPRNEKGTAIAYPPNPKKKLMLGAGAGLALGLIVALGIEKLQNKLFSTNDLELRGRLPVLAKIPEKLLNRLASLPPDLPLNLSPDLPSEKAENSVLQLPSTIIPLLSDLYLNLHFHHRHPPVRTMLIVAINDEPAQSAIAVSLAQTFAIASQQLLLVDANITRPEIHEFFELSSESGLLNILDHPTQVLTTIQKSATLPYVGILPLGSAENPAQEIRLSAHLPALKNIFMEHYNLVIINASTISNTIEFNLLCEQVDGILMIIRRRRLPLSEFKKVIQQIQQYDFPLLGFIEVS